MTLILRRSFLVGLPVLLAGAASGQSFDPLAAPGRASGLLDIGTPQMTLGPFYPVIKPHDIDADLTRIGRNGTWALGEVIDVAGVVTGGDGKTPVPGAVLDIWQAAASGAYNHPSDPNTAPRDPNLQGFARLRADGQGRFRFRTVMPGPYGQRAPHIHFDVAGRKRRLITQMLFPDHPLNATDNVLLAVRNPDNRSRAIARRVADAPSGDPPLFQYVIALGGE
jgi:protocatechuate 3,4-dioxygenase beta subunit